MVAGANSRELQLLSRLRRLRSDRLLTMTNDARCLSLDDVPRCPAVSAFEESLGLDAIPTAMNSSGQAAGTLSQPVPR